MGARRTPITVMNCWQSDIRQMKRAGTRVIWSCQACGKWGPVDLDPLAIAMGGWDMTLWDCYPPCEVDDCTGLVMFHASPSASTPTRPMRSTTLGHYELPAAAWMAGWTGWHEFRPYERPARSTRPRTAGEQAP
jgi:hypothetical protein